ncbi:putative proteasome activator subunit 3 (PA28 gamma) [Monocercomonoides exilis]|uniref:putative proteasome activator subunit 3 (PA28 gamma) n=1 Tax=Monocercomonoides exilis TaxID=2049356 RepID=UPI0035599BBD|nr:putative proteasome activator subunit 3 (PA28 gamma) [Monocercomonoides exilis]|eukprot:MONOS_2867.1-p1 / transcript=MONOS_2867.1 / gene=MONOS_2867 / organism=Monocercomonoides_exilis_PA203 / gene_product=unspecified product / transcript_product=unspecified product / location=Mono_scaffold00062:72249-73292(+) / protein_length=221 / sequence_SO=supercontig / SO=protein_coding / is_pseudo=false
MASEIKSDVSLENLIDPHLKEKSMAMIKTFSEKALELDRVAMQNTDYLDHSSERYKSAMLLTQQIIDKPTEINAPVNDAIENLNQMVLDYLSDFVRNLSTFRLWFSLQKPAITDSTIFGAEVMDLIVSTAQSLESMGVEGLSKFSQYSDSRAKLFVKFYRFPFLDDVGKCIMEMEERQIFFCVQTLTDLRNFYLFIHDIVVKNFDKLKAPHMGRTFAPNSV